MYQYKAKLDRVVDGDTFEFIVDMGFKITTNQRFRLAKVDTPEIHGVASNSQEYKKGMKAKRYVEKRFKQNRKEMTIQTYKWPGKFGRYIVIIWLADSKISLNDELVKKGLAEKVNFVRKSP